MVTDNSGLGEGVAMTVTTESGVSASSAARASGKPSVPNERDYAALQAAVKEGQVEATTEM